MKKYKQEFIEFMVECNVLTFGDFVTKSGRKTPFFVNTGNYQTGEQLSKLGDFYAKAIKENFDEDIDVLFGPAYKGIPLCVTTSISLNSKYDMNVRYCSNRKEIKDHGDKGILLGTKLKDKDKILIIEDVTTAGTSIRETMPILKNDKDVDVVGLIISVNRMERGTCEKSALDDIKDTYNMKTCAIVDMNEVVKYLHNKEINGQVIIDDDMKSRIEDYYKIYGVEK
ncbi:MAG: orotate phosphoribosyltransferase [Tepidibacter sp.]|jgi:orotate phosphoribosyltransferase|uniref:orotate phosphoribosyltransferase n=1 Tax=Tepidibacter sp. TaxID=2529387 RepID=UPI0025D2343A|nr:orotate phosphoribosyltransferase [Tepidibacter sp.]MCT4508711.1 orotate phosphoribosyltransferase [Tepidibacter sp.]